MLSTLLFTVSVSWGAAAPVSPFQEPKGYLDQEAQRGLGLGRQAPARGAAPVPRDPTKVRFDDGGWPTFDPAGRVRTPSDFDPVLDTPVPSVGAGGEGPAVPAGESRARSLPFPAIAEGRAGQVPAGSSDSPLADVFAAVGSPIRAHNLGGVRVRARMELMDARGAVVGGVQELVHEAEFGGELCDRLQLPGELVFGRNEHGSFAERAALPWPALDEAAGDHLDVQGMLLRFPWGFADSRTYAALPPREESLGGERRVVYRIERDRRGPTAMGPTNQGVVDHFEIWCDPSTRMPLELRYVIGSTGAERRVRLSAWRPIEGAGLMVAHRREVTDSDGRLLMVIELDGVEVGLDMPAEQFRPQ